MNRMICRLSWTAVVVCLLPLQLAVGAPLQLLRNGGFEEDEVTFRAEPASSCGGEQNDQWSNQQDRFPDVWIWPGQCAPGRGIGGSEWPRDEVTMDTVAHAGSHSLRLQGKTVRIEQTIAWNSIGDQYADMSRYQDHTADFLVRPGLFQDLVLDGWFKSKDVPADAAGTVTLKIEGRVETNVAVAKGTADWTAFQIRVPAGDLAQKDVKGQPGRNFVVALAYASPGGTGQVWFDDLSVTTAERSEPNLLPDPSFETEATGAKAYAPTGRGTETSCAPPLPAGEAYPSGWSAPMKWLFLPQPTYYIWNSWQHFFTPGRGHPRLDRLVSHSGRSSLRFELLPGDEYAIDSPTIVLNQTEARPVEVTAWVRADRARHFDLILLDDQGRRVPANTTLTFWGGQTGGTYDWVAVRKVYQGFTPLKTARLRIGARGFNGQRDADIGVYHAYNQVSTVWVDDVAVREMYSTADDLRGRGVKVPAVENPDGGVRVVNLDLGERLFGENELAAAVRNDSKKAAKVAVQVKVTSPAGKEQKVERGREVRIEPGQSALVTAAYRLEELSESWKKQGRMTVTLAVNGKPAATEDYAYGTWPVIADVRPSKAFLDETENPILVAVNLGLAKKTLATVKTLDIEVIDRRTGKAVLATKINDVPAALASAKLNAADKDRFYFYMPREGLLDHRNLVLTELDISKLPVRPWNDPESDWLIRVSAGKTFSADSHPFAKLTKFNETLPAITEVTVDPVGHFLRVNGQPYIVLAESHGNGVGCWGAPPSRLVSFNPTVGKACNLNGIGRWAGMNNTTSVWAGGLYSPMVMANRPNAADLQDRLRLLEAGQIVMAKTYGDAITNTLAEVNALPGAVGIFTSMSEGIISDSPDLRAEEQFADAVRKKLNRPIGTMDNHSQFYPWNAEPGGLLDHVNLLYMEREEGGMFRPELCLRDWMKRKNDWMICDMPQTYENVPHARARYVALKNTLNGARGWFGIQGCTDSSLYRGLGGELRHIFTYLSANEGGPEVTAPEGVTVKTWKKGPNVLVMAEQHNPVPHGQWQWQTGIAGRQSAAHTGASRHIVTPVKEGYAIHGYNDDVYREIGTGDEIRQELYVDPARRPKAVFLIVPGNNDFNHIGYWGDFDWNDFKSKKVDAFLAGECYSLAGMGINWPVGTDPVFAEYQAKRRFPQSCFVRLGDLPKPGEWATLTVPLDKLGLTGKVVDGLMFMTSGASQTSWGQFLTVDRGLAWWGKSILARKDGRVETMLDGRIGRDPAQFQQAQLKIAGWTKGAVRVVGENRSLALKDGALTDDLKGEDLWGFFTDGLLGDGITYGTPRDSVPAELFLSYTYDDSPRCIRVYEITP